MPFGGAGSQSSTMWPRTVKGPASSPPTYLFTGVQCELFQSHSDRSGRLTLIISSSRSGTYISPISVIVSDLGISLQQYADDTQLYISVSADDLTVHLDSLESCLQSLHLWLCHNGLGLNSGKSESIFTARRSYASAVLGVVILSVRPSLCPSVTRVLCD